MKIIDTFIFFDELDLIEDRFKFLYDHVDHFVLIESNRKFGGENKPLLFHENRSRYSKYLDKIIHKPMFFPKEMDFGLEFGSNQAAECMHRDYTKEAVAEFNDRDIILCSDVDEIPNPHQFDKLRNLFTNHEDLIVRLVQEMYYYDLTNKQELLWARSYACRKTLFDKHTPNHIRLNSYQLESNEMFFDIYDGGWHLTNFMPIANLIEKILNYPHEVYITEQNLNLNVIRERIAAGIDLFGREDVKIAKSELSSISPHFLNAFERWKQYNGEVL